MQGKCSACGFVGVVDRAHLKTRGAGAGWDEHEWIPLCRRHHVEQGQVGWPRFTENYARVRFLIDEMGWEIKDIFGQKKLVRK